MSGTKKISPTHIAPSLLKTLPLPSILINFSIAIIVNTAKRGTQSAPDPADDGRQTLEPQIKRGRKTNDSKDSTAVVTVAAPKTASAAIEAKTTTDAVVPATGGQPTSTRRKKLPLASDAVAQKAAGQATQTTAAAKKPAASTAESTATTSPPALKSPSCDWNFTAADKCKFHSLAPVQCDFVVARIDGNPTTTLRWITSPNSVAIIMKIINKEQSIADALVAAAPGADDVRATLSRGENKNNPGK